MKLNLSNRNLTSLDGIPLPDGLKELDVSGNRWLTSLPPLPPTLTMLDCGYNDLTSLPPLPPSLTALYCQSNRLSSLPPLPPTLVLLYCHCNQLTNLPPLPSSVTVLSCYSNQLDSLPPLSMIGWLYCHCNQLTSLQSLPPRLDALYCQANRLTKLPPLPPSLTKLYCFSNQLPDHYYCDDGQKPINELRIIIRMDRWREGLSIVSRLMAERAARNIQRVWKRYWLEPYHDAQMGYPVSRYLLHYQHEL